MVQPKASVVGVTIMSDVLEAAAFSACAHDKASLREREGLMTYQGEGGAHDVSLIWERGAQLTADLTIHIVFVLVVYYYK